MAGYGSGRYGRWRYSRTPNDREIRHAQAWVGGMRAGPAYRVMAGAALAMGWPSVMRLQPNKQHSVYMVNGWPVDQQTIAGKIKTVRSVHRWPVAGDAGLLGRVRPFDLGMGWQTFTDITPYRVLATQEFALIAHWPVDVLIRPTYVWNPDPSPVETWSPQLPETEFWQEQDRTNVIWKDG